MEVLSACCSRVSKDNARSMKHDDVVVTGHPMYSMSNNSDTLYNFIIIFRGFFILRAGDPPVDISERSSHGFAHNVFVGDLP